MRNSTAVAVQHVFTGIARAVLLAGLASATAVPAQGIYTCTDGKGRRLTADRPITECSDQEQKVLNPSGTVKSRIGPVLTAQERAALALKEKDELEEQARRNEEKRRNRALLVRYPNRVMHDNERAEALTQIGVVRKAAAHRVDELLRQRKLINEEMEFYKKDPSKAPAPLLRQVDEVANSLAVQARFIADQDSELKRVNTRFDDELMRLKQLWAQQPVAPATVTRNAR
jgi:hypothetical protein